MVLLQPTPTLQDTLRLVGIVPEIGSRGRWLELRYFVGGTGGVKDTPAGLKPASRGPGVDV